MHAETDLLEPSSETVEIPPHSFLAQATADLEATPTDKNLDMVRNILFGEQARENEKRLAMLERFVKVWTSSIREEMRKHIDGLSAEIRLLKDLLAEENKARLTDIAHTRERFVQTGRSIEDLSRRTQTAHEQLTQYVDAEAARLSQDINAQRQDILAQLNFAVNQLKYDKADRKAVALLLAEASRQLAAEAG